MFKRKQIMAQHILIALKRLHQYIPFILHYQKKYSLYDSCDVMLTANLIGLGFWNA